MDIDFRNELIRKGIHFLMLAVPIGYNYLSSAIVIPVLSVLAFVFVLIDILRTKIPSFKARVNQFMGGIFRIYESKTFSGASFILFGALLAVIIFPRQVAQLVVTFTVLGDIAAALVGKHIGKHKLIGKSTVEGSISFLAASIIGSLFITPYPLWEKILAAVFATIVEMLPLKIDDNLTVPILTGTFIVIIESFII